MRRGHINASLLSGRAWRAVPTIARDLRTRTPEDESSCPPTGTLFPGETFLSTEPCSRSADPVSVASAGVSGVVGRIRSP